MNTKILFLIACLLILTHNQCGEGCSTCNSVTGSCYTCQTNYSMSCDAQSLEANCYCFICSQVIPNCLQCGNLVCNQCQPSFYINSISKCSGCGSYCLSCVQSNACNQCMANYTTNPLDTYSNCQPICGIANCLGCSEVNFCSSCSQGYTVDIYGECYIPQKNRWWIGLVVIFIAALIGAIVIVLSCKKHKRCCFKNEELFSFNKSENSKRALEIEI